MAVPGMRIGRDASTCHAPLHPALTGPFGERFLEFGTVIIVRLRLEANIVVNFNGKRTEFPGMKRSEFISWLNAEAKLSDVKIQLKGKHAELKALAKSFEGPETPSAPSPSDYPYQGGDANGSTSLTSKTYPFHQKVFGVHSFDGYPGGIGDRATAPSVILPGWHVEC